MPPLDLGENSCAESERSSALMNVTRSRSLSLFESAHPGQGSLLSVSLAPRSWHAQAFQPLNQASSSQGCLMSLRLFSSRGLDNVDTLVPYAIFGLILRGGVGLCPPLEQDLGIGT